MLRTLSNAHNTTLRNMTYKLGKNVNEPIIHLDGCTNIFIYDLYLDGNKENQTSEISTRFGYCVRNSCISLRKCKNIYISNCRLYNARSGGIVPSLCENIYIINCECSGNFFDGIAPYASSNVLIYNCCLTNNLYSGVSIDGNSSNINIYGSTIKDNRDWGVWFGSKQNVNKKIICDIVSNNSIINNKTGNICPSSPK